MAELPKNCNHWLTSAKADVGSIEDESFLTATFAGADAVFIMISPNFAVENLRHYQNIVARNYVAAITASDVKNVVLLSSIGAHMGNGACPIDGLADLEDLLSGLEGMNARKLRPSYFMYNLFGMIPLIKNMQMMGANFGGTDEKIVLVHTNDIAAVAAEELLALNFTSQSVRYIGGDEKTSTEIAEILSAAVDKPGTHWIDFFDEQVLDGVRKGGLAETFAEG